MANPDVGLETHIQDILNVLRYEALSDVIIVGHSSSGVIITGVADHVPERIAHLAYLDAFVPIYPPIGPRPSRMTLEEIQSSLYRPVLARGPHGSLRQEGPANVGGVH